MTRRGGARLAQLFVLFAALMALLLGGLTTMSLATHSPPDGNPGHCPDHQDAEKDNNPKPGDVNSLVVDGTIVWLHYSDDLKTVEFYADKEGMQPLAVEFCVKASNRHSGEHTGTEFTVDWTTNGGQIPMISYVVVYGIADVDDCPHDLTLSPGHGENQLGDTHTVTATVTDGENACPGIEVRFEVDPAEGAVFLSDQTVVTGPDGTATFSYTRDHESNDTITACTTDEGEAPASCDEVEVTIKATATKDWVEEPDGCPADLTLSPGHGENQLGDTHTVTATVTDGENACPGIEVRFEVDPAEGAVFLSDQTVVTGPDGTATFSYTRDHESNDTITACTTDEGEAPASCDEVEVTIKATATKDWVVDEVEFFCRSDVITVGLGGDDVLIPFEANEPSEPCATDADGLLVALSPLLGEGGLGILNDKNQIELGEEGFGSLTLDLLWARTEAGDDSAHANSGVLFFVANDGTDDQIILEVGTSENSTDADCNNSTMATLLAITLAGERFEVTGGNVVLIDPALDDLVIIRIEDGNQGGADEGPDDTGAQALDVGALMNNITATVADSESGCTD